MKSDHPNYDRWAIVKLVVFFVLIVWWTWFNRDILFGVQP